MWYVIVFPREDTVAAVPASWYIHQTDECFWPPAKTKKSDINRFVKESYLPGDDWEPYKARLLGKYSDHKTALAKLSKAKDKDKLSSTENEETGRGKRKKIRKHSYHLNSSSDADNSDDSVNSLSIPNVPGHSQIQKNEASSEGIPVPQNHSSSALQQNRANSSVDVDRRRDLVETPVRSSPPTRRSLSPTRSHPEVTPQSQHSLSERKRKRNSSQECSSSRSRLEISPNLSSRSTNHLQEERLGGRIAMAHMDIRTDGDTSGQILAILQKIQNDDAEFKIQVLRKLNLLNMKINDLEMSINKVNGGVQAEDVEDFDCSNWFPLDIDKLNNLESVLANEVEQKKMVKHLSRVGGADVSETVKRLMYKMLTNEVGNSFSWDGAKGKKKFKNLKLAKVILSAVRVNDNTKNATEADIIIFIKKWLVRCKDRINLQNKRNERLNQIEEEELLPN